ncbi:oligosaccharide flippase family protein, partial [Noviherbaspirillum sp.]|uniref:oligosaccharide flippase family protein n=1 Tax=Noviherbaspirillum sp. TaxID=1926288 RepID=UPI002D3CF1D8
MHTLRFFIFNLLGHTLPMAVALVSVPVIAHFAGVERLGALGVVWALVGYFSFLDFGLSRVVTRRVAQAKEQGRIEAELLDLRGFFWWRAVPALLAMTVLFLAARAVFGAYLPEGELGRELAASWPWIAFGIPVTLATNWLRGALEGVHRFARVNLMRTVFGAWTYAAPAVAALLMPTLDAMIVGIVLGRVVALAAHVWACLQAERGILVGPVRARLAGQGLFFQEGGWITVSNVIGPLMLYSDRFVLAALASPAAVAWYVTSQEVLLRTMVIPAALAGVLFPKFAGNLDARTEVPLAALYQRGIRLISA